MGIFVLHGRQSLTWYCDAMKKVFIIYFFSYLFILHIYSKNLIKEHIFIFTSSFIAYILFILLEILYLVNKASTASSNVNAYAYKGNSGELHSRQAKSGVNLPLCFAAQSKLRLSYKMKIKTKWMKTRRKQNHRTGFSP